MVVSSNTKLLGTAAIITSVAFYGLFGTFAKLTGGTFQPFTQNWVRSVFIAAFVIIYAIFAKYRFKKVRKEDIKWLIAWTFSGALNPPLLFIAFNNIQIGTSYFLLYSTMIGTGFICGKIFFNEKVTILKIISLSMSAFGLAIIYFLDIKAANFVYMILAMTAGVMVGAWNTLSKKVSDKYPNLQLIFTDALISAFLSVLVALILRERVPVVSVSVAWIATVGWAIANLSATGLLVLGFKHLEAQIASIIMPLEVLFGSFFAFLFFGQILPITTFIGGLLIASAAVLASLNIRKT